MSKGGDDADTKLLSYPVLAQHVRERRLACIIEAQEEDACLLVPKADVAEDVKEPVEHCQELQRLCQCVEQCKYEREDLQYVLTATTLCL